MITLKTLVTIAPFSNEMQTKLLELLPTLSDEKKVEITELCWEMISEQYEIDVQFATQNALLEMASGQKHYSEEDLLKIADDRMVALAERLETKGEKGVLLDVRTELAKISKNPLKRFFFRNNKPLN